MVSRDRENMAPLSNTPLGTSPWELSQSSGISASSGFAPAIYVVDDEPMVGEVINTILRLECFETRLFQDPVKALVAFTEADQRPELLISDYAMIPINGAELIHECLRLEPSLKTILISGNVSEEITQNLKIKPDAFISKPFQPKPFVKMVRSILADPRPATAPRPMRTLIWQS